MHLPDDEKYQYQKEQDAPIIINMVNMDRILSIYLLYFILQKVNSTGFQVKVNKLILCR